MADDNYDNVPATMKLRAALELKAAESISQILKAPDNLPLDLSKTNAFVPISLSVLQEYENVMNELLDIDDTMFKEIIHGYYHMMRSNQGFIVEQLTTILENAFVSRQQLMTPVMDPGFNKKVPLRGRE